MEDAAADPEDFGDFVSSISYFVVRIYIGGNVWTGLAGPSYTERAYNRIIHRINR
jgi:hypothetical protein